MIGTESSGNEGRGNICWLFVSVISLFRMGLISVAWGERSFPRKHLLVLDHGVEWPLEMCRAQLEAAGRDALGRHGLPGPGRLTEALLRQGAAIYGRTHQISDLPIIFELYYWRFWSSY